MERYVSEGKELSLEAEAAALRFGQMYDAMRAGAQFDMDHFLSAWERGMGGQITMSVSSDRSRKGNVEVGYASEGLLLKAS